MSELRNKLALLNKESRKIEMVYIQSKDELKEYFEKNKAEYTQYDEVVYEGQYGKELLTLEVKYSPQEGVTDYYIGGESFDNLEDLNRYIDSY